MRISLKKEMEHWNNVKWYCEHAGDENQDMLDDKSCNIMERVGKSNVLLGEKIEPNLAVDIRRHMEERKACYLGRHTWYYQRYKQIDHPTIAKRDKFKALAVHRITSLIIRMLNGEKFVETGNNPHIF